MHYHSGPVVFVFSHLVIGAIRSVRTIMVLALFLVYLGFTVDTSSVANLTYALVFGGVGVANGLFARFYNPIRRSYISILLDVVIASVPLLYPEPIERPWLLATYTLFWICVNFVSSFLFTANEDTMRNCLTVLVVVLGVCLEWYTYWYVGAITMGVGVAAVTFFVKKYKLSV